MPDIAVPAGERVDRGGTALLFRVPEGLWIDLDADAPPELNVAIRRSLVRELERRLDAAALDQRPDDTVHDVLSLRELAIRAPDRAEAEAIVEEALARLIRLHDPDGAGRRTAHDRPVLVPNPAHGNDRTMTAARANVLRSNAVFRRMWSARAISFIGDGIALTALVLYIQDTRGTGTAVAALLLAQALPHLLGPVAGTVADRVDQRTLMIGCDLGRAVLFGAAAWFLPSMAWLLVVMAAASTLDTLFAPAGRSAVPALVEDADLVNANAWLGTALNLQVALGPLIGGALVAVIDVRGALAVDAGSFLLSALLLLGVPKLLPSIRRADRERFMPEMRAGLAYARSHPVARAVVVTLFLGVAFAGIDNVALVFLARDQLGAGPAGFGAVASAFGVGMLVASVMLSRRTSSITPRALFIGGWAMTGLGTLLTAVAPAVWFAVAAQAVSGAGNGADNVASDTLLQRSVPRAMLGRVFGLTSTAAFVGGGLAYAAGGPLLDATSARTVFLIGAAGTFAVVLLATRLLPRSDL